jgi:hypothetical protein
MFEMVSLLWNLLIMVRQKENVCYFFSESYLKYVIMKSDQCRG